MANIEDNLDVLRLDKMTDDDLERVSMIEAGQPIRTVQLWLGHANIQNTVKYLHESYRQFDGVEF